MLNKAELERYARHVSIPQIGIEGQSKLKESSVLIIGAGGLSSPCALYLAAAGVGNIGIVDADQIETSNLQRQILYGQSSLNTSKVDSAKLRLLDLNPHISIQAYNTRFSVENAWEIAEKYDIIIDGSDNFQTRYLSNDVAFFLKKPVIYAAIHRFDGQLSVFAPHLGGPCYRCMLPTMPKQGTVPNCSEAGVLGVLPGIIGTMQATEAIKLILGIGNLALGTLIIYDALHQTMRHLQLRRDRSCHLCGNHPTIQSIHNAETLAPHHCSMPHIPSVSPQEFQANPNAFSFVLDVREPWEHEQDSIENSTLIPLGFLPQRLNEIPRDQTVLVYCKAGIRSERACQFMHEHQFSNVTNLTGGIDALRSMD